MPYYTIYIILQMNPPCIDITTASPSLQPKFIAKITQHADSKSNPFQLTTNSIDFVLSYNNIYCYNYISGATCTGIDGRNCTCVTKLSPLPKYTQLRASIYINYHDADTNKEVRIMTFTRIYVCDV